MLVRALTATVLSFACVSCIASKPTKAEFDAADRGPQPSLDVAERAARWVLDNVLGDPVNAKVTFSPVIDRGYTPSGSGWEYCWVFTAGVFDWSELEMNRRQATYEFYFANDRLYGFSTSIYAGQGLGGNTHRVQRVIDEPSLEVFRRGETPTWRTLKDLDEL